MPKEFAIGALTGKFGIVKLWPGISVAEDECIARIKDAAEHLGLECVVVDHYGLAIDEKSSIAASDLDFVLSIHFERPKLYPAYSYYAIWNPTQFYFDWGYDRVSRNAASHDAFLTSDGTASVAMIRRILSGKDRSDAPMLPFYPSLSLRRCLEPTLGAQKLFYCGINWDRGGNVRNKGRHHDLLKRLDDPRQLEIYGPEKLFDVRVWEGFDSYVGELAFDGVSLLEAANRAGVVLALSSAAHRESGIVSNRLWEGLASGAFIICDQPDFGRRHFGDNLAYVDSDLHSARLAEQILEHLEWIRANPEAALEKAKAAQEVFKENYTLEKSISGLYEHQKQLRSAAKDKEAASVSVLLVTVDFDERKFSACLKSISGQSHSNLHLTIVVDENMSPDQLAELNFVLRSHQRPYMLSKVKFSDGNGNFRGLGRILEQHLRKACADPGGFTMIIGQDEVLLPNHVEAGLRALERSVEADAALSDVVREWPDEPHRHQDIITELQENDPVFGPPTCPSRFLARNAAISRYFDTLVPYLHGNPLLPVILFDKITRTGLATVLREYGRIPKLPKGLAEGQSKDRFLIREFRPKEVSLAALYPYKDESAVISEIVSSRLENGFNPAVFAGSQESEGMSAGGPHPLSSGEMSNFRKWRKRNRAVNQLLHAPRDLLRWVKRLFAGNS